MTNSLLLRMAIEIVSIPMEQWWMFPYLCFVYPFRPGSKSSGDGLRPDVAKRIVVAAWMLHEFRFGR